MKAMRVLFMGIVCTCFSINAVFGQTVGENAASIVRAVDEKQRSASSRQDLVMTVYPDMADESNKREFSIRNLSKGDDDSYMEFVEPKSIKGLRILSKGDDNWVFFPSTGRTRKIAGTSKKDSVQGVGGDFSYEDIGTGTFESKYTFTIVKNEGSAWVLEGLAKTSSAVYSKVLVTVDKAKMLPTRIEFYTKEDGRYKELTLSDFKVMGGREIPTRMSMVNLKKKSKTIVVVKAAEFDLTIDDKYFNPSRFDK
jgi:hypothetical protein